VVHPAGECLRIVGEFVICTGIASGALARRELKVPKPRHVHADRFPGLGCPNEHMAPSCAGHARAAFPAARRTPPLLRLTTVRRGPVLRTVRRGIHIIEISLRFRGNCDREGKPWEKTSNIGEPLVTWYRRSGEPLHDTGRTLGTAQLAHIARIRRVPSDMMPSMGSSMFPQVAACARPWSQEAP